MTEEHLLVLYTDASTTVTGRVLMQIQDGREFPFALCAMPYRIKLLDGGLRSWSYSLWFFILSSYHHAL
jgi:hypothetical protein